MINLSTYIHTSNEYLIYDIIEMKVNIGCGKDILPWYVNMDLLKLPWVDLQHDLEVFPYPFETSSVDEVFCSHVLEHVTDLTKTMTELVRIVKKWGVIKVKVPYFANPNGRSDPTHHRLFTSNSFNYFTKDCFYNDLDIEVTKTRIHFFSNLSYFKSDAINIIPDALINLFPKIYERFFAFIFPSVEIHFLLTVNK